MAPAYRTVSRPVEQIITGMVPIDLLEEARRKIFVERRFQYEASELAKRGDI